MAEAILQAIKLSKNELAIYNITDKESFTLVESLIKIKKLNNLKFKELFITKKICLIIGYISEFFYIKFKIKKPPLLTLYLVDQMSSDHIFDISKAKKELKYNPIKNIENDFIL